MIGGPGPAQTAQLVVVVPVPAGPIPRSRLTFSGTTGTLTPTAATFVIQRSGDSMYWNGAVGGWVPTLYENPAVSGTPATTWTYSVTGAARRQFANTVVSVELRGMIAGVQNASAVDATLVIR